MTFHEDIAAIQAAITGCGATGAAGNAFAQTAPGLREGRRLLETLAAQFDTHIRPSVICLPMGDAWRDAALDAGIP